MGQPIGKEGLSVKWSPDLGCYASDEMDLINLHCALCTNAPCACPPFGTAAYFALLARRHHADEGDDQ